MNDTLDWQILVVDDDKDLCRQVKEHLETLSFGADHRRCNVTPITNFDDAMVSLETGRIDVLILDVRQNKGKTNEDESIGRSVFDQVKERRFVPIVFYTGIPYQVEDLRSHLVQVVEKTQGIEGLGTAISRVFESRLPIINRALVRHTEVVQRKYMWSFVADNWQDLAVAEDISSIAYLLARRLALSLENGLTEMLIEIGGNSTEISAEKKAHPMHQYIMPPLDDSLYTGDLFCSVEDGTPQFHILLTPSCDLAQSKAEKVVLAACSLFTERKEYRQWLGNPSEKQDALDQLMKNNKGERYHFLPGAIALPSLIADFHNVKSTGLADLSKMKRIASMDSPYREYLMSRYVRYVGRIGTPDLDLDLMRKRLKP